jgi:uncharacterized protein YjbI with pentapeptide repeats
MKKENKRTIRITAPRIPKSLIENEVFEHCLEDEEEIIGEKFMTCDIEDLTIHRARLSGVVFNNVTFREVGFIGCDIEDVIFENCDLSNINLSDSTIFRTEFINCKMVGANLSGINFQDVSMNSCMGRYANGRYSTFKQFKIEDSFFDLADFQNAAFKESILKNTSFRECQMSGATLHNMDLSSCDIEGLGVRIEDVKGAIVSPVQAVSLAHLFGLIIKE